MPHPVKSYFRSDTLLSSGQKGPKALRTGMKENFKRTLYSDWQEITKLVVCVV